MENKITDRKHGIEAIASTCLGVEPHQLNNREQYSFQSAERRKIECQDLHDFFIE